MRLRLAESALIASGASRESAASTASALVSAEIDGQAAHGLSRVASFRCCEVGQGERHSRPVAKRVAPAVIRIDAGNGFAYPAIDLAIGHLAPLARGWASPLPASMLGLLRPGRAPRGAPCGDRPRCHGLCQHAPGHCVPWWAPRHDGDESDRVRGATRRSRAACHRSGPLRGRTRQDHCRGKGGQGDSRWLGSGRAGRADHRSRSSAAGRTATDRRRQGRSARADDRNPLRRSRRWGVRLGSELVL